MGNLNRETREKRTYLYTYSYPEEELELGLMEQRAFFGECTKSQIIISSVNIDPSRSPFIKEKLEVMIEADTLNELVNKVKDLPPTTSTFKAVVINLRNTPVTHKISYEERRKIERHVGLMIPGQADLNSPEFIYGIMKIREKWFLGKYTENTSVWHQHQRKPHQYSTALSTRVARAIVNIAVPDPAGIKVIDPCCGIGTVLVEALSMGIDIVGSDNNPLVMKGARENIAHFGFDGQVILQDIREVTGSFDVAIIDMPYNLCSVITAEEQLEMLQSARSFTKKAVIVTIEPIEGLLTSAGFQTVDHCRVKKGKFVRDILVCESLLSND